jgi:predicted metal-binding membrane protein
LQWLLQQLSLLNPEMVTTSKILGGIILISAGVFQFTPLKTDAYNSAARPLILSPIITKKANGVRCKWEWKTACIAWAAVG